MEEYGLKSLEGRPHLRKVISMGKPLKAFKQEGDKLQRVTEMDH